MSDDRVTETHTTTTGPATPGHTTVVERRSGGSGLLIGLVLLVAVVIGGFYLFNQNRNDTIKTEAISDAAGAVGDSAKKVGDAASDVVTPDGK